MNVLLVLSQIPQDPASGAARSMRTICRMLANQEGFSVRMLGLDSTESKSASSHRLPIDEEFCDGSTKCIIASNLRTIEDAFSEELSRSPDIFFTFGCSPHEIDWQDRSKEAGAKVVFGLRNFGYLDKPKSFFDRFDGILVSTKCMRGAYSALPGVATTSLPLPIDPIEVVADESERKHVSYVNPMPEKGCMFAAGVIRDIAEHGVPVKVFESRYTADYMISEARKSGVDIMASGNVTICEATNDPREIYRGCKAVIMPSITEPAGRVAAEAMMNGIPVVASNRGGLPEVCNGGASLLSVSLLNFAPSSQVVSEWTGEIFRLFRDENYYSERSSAALEASKIYDYEAVSKQYAGYFLSIFEQTK